MEQCGEKVMLFEVEGPLSYATARDITRMMQEAPINDVLVIDLSKVPFIDSSAASSLEEATQNLKQNGDQIVIFGARKKVIDTLNKTDIFEFMDKNQLVETRLEALKLAKRLTVT
jgi:SulP family sulfate permease